MRSRLLGRTGAGLLAAAAMALGGSGKPTAEAPALARDMELTAFVEAWSGGARVSAVDAAPERIRIDAALAADLGRQPLDGGREQSLYFRIENGRLVLERAVPGGRYRASGRCSDCSPQVLGGHTHPYDNPFSPQDIYLTASSGRPELVVLRGGGMFLAVPTQHSDEAARDRDDLVSRMAVFGNRTQCPGPAAGAVWVSAPGMPRHVEAQMRAAADIAAVALYQLRDGVFVRLPPMTFDEPRLRTGAPVGFGELNAYEQTMVSLLRRFNEARAEDPAETFRRRAAITPDSLPASAPFQALDYDGQPIADSDVILMQRYGLEASFFAPLPTTAYTERFNNADDPELSFISVQWSPDCREVRWLEGVQRFSPDGVTYRRGWSRPANARGPLNQGWRPLPAAALPRDHVVPW